MKRLYKNKAMRYVAMDNGLQVGAKVAIHYRALLQNLEYITREIVNAKVIKLYPYMFECETSTGQRECFRYNEFLGDEHTLVVLRK